MVKPTKSKYSDYFDVNKDKANCKICGSTIKLSDRSTRGLKTHLETKHQIKLNNDEVEVGQAVSMVGTSKASKQQSLDKFVVKPSVEELISRESANGATFRYLARSKLIRKGLAAYGYQDKTPKSHSMVKRLVHKSAETHRGKIREKLQRHLKNGHRFCSITDEWTCPAKKRKYLNVQLHLKGHNFNLGMVPGIGRLPAPVMKEKYIKRIEAFGLSFQKDIFYTTNDRCSTMLSLG